MNIKEKVNKFKKTTLNFYNRKYYDLKNKKHYIIDKKNKKHIYNVNQWTLRGKLTKSEKYFKQYYFEKKYQNYIKSFFDPKVFMQNIIGNFFRKKFFLKKKSLQLVFKRYRRTLQIKQPLTLKEKKFSFKENVQMKYKVLSVFLKKNMDNFSVKLAFSLKKFFQYHILKLFRNFNFKFYFFQLMKKITEILNIKEKYLFLKYEFFGHAYFKYKLFFILKYKLLNLYFIQSKNTKFNFQIKNKIEYKFIYKKFFYKLFFLKKLKYNFSLIKCWLLNFFLNKYQGFTNGNFNILKEQTKYKTLGLDLQKIFYIYYSIYDRNFKSFIIINKKFTNWLFYHTNRKKQKIKNLFEIFGYEDDFSFTSDNFNKNFLLNIYKSLIFIHLSIKLNNVFVTLSNMRGEVLFKYSTGFYGISGKKKRDPLTLYNIINNIIKRLKKFSKLNLILKIKRRFKNKYFKQVLNSLKKNKIVPLCYFFIVNRNISKRRLRKVRRL